MRISAVLAAALVLGGGQVEAGGGGEPPKPAPAPAPAAAAPAGGGQADPAAAAAARAAMLRKKVLREEDFSDHDESNRDPFRSYLRLFVEKGTPRVQQVQAIFDKFALEELTLIAVISGDSSPRAMFRDPTGLGQTVKRGEYVSKAGARVTKILSDRVILELSEIAPSGEARALEKAILVNPERSQR